MRKTLLTLAAEAIRAQNGPWREDWQLRLRRSFNRENFFLSPEGLLVFWQMYALGGTELGVPSFLLPYGEEGCRFPGEAPPAEKESGAS